jgi:hypothetical protein
MQTKQTQARGEIRVWWTQAKWMGQGSLVAPRGIRDGNRVSLLDHPAQKVSVSVVPQQQRELALDGRLVGTRQANEQITARLSDVPGKLRIAVPFGLDGDQPNPISEIEARAC